MCSQRPKPLPRDITNFHEKFDTVEIFRFSTCYQVLDRIPDDPHALLTKNADKGGNRDVEKRASSMACDPCYRGIVGAARIQPGENLR